MSKPEGGGGSRGAPVGHSADAEARPNGPFVIGLGEVGRRIAAAFEAAGARPRPVTRAAGWEAALDEAELAPRIVAVREESLREVWARFGPVLRPRVVLVQNGFLEDLVGASAAPGSAARGLIWFTSKGSFFRELMPSIFFGDAALPLAAALARAGLAARVLSEPEDFRRELVLKGVWNAVVGLPLAAHGVDLGTYRAAFAEELAALVDESCRAASAEYDVTVSAEEALERLATTTGELDWVRGGTRALGFRNGAIARFGRRHGVSTPVTDRLLEAVGWIPEAGG
ncbi:MAG: hypothetical protein MUC67_11100 [Acidobacteria bacterium]|nr:hypothetical protein [Acidobacteriota bacterium]MCU0253483.1 hypothetical protein [Acidobacteriota bacterium]